MTNDSSCIFCKIVAGDIKAQVVAENDQAVAFLDAQPIAPGHTLVVPRTHAEALKDLSPEAVGPLFQLVREVAQLLQERLTPDGMTIGINQGKTAGQAVPHLHVHLLPRFAGDGGKSIHSVVQNPPTDSLEEVAKKLAS